jgi:hypothetical protein
VLLGQSRHSRTPLLLPVMSVVRRSIWVMGGMVPPIDPSGMPCEQPCGTPLSPCQSGGKALKRGTALCAYVVRAHMRATLHVLYHMIAKLFMISCDQSQNASCTHVLIRNNETARA